MAIFQMIVQQKYFNQLTVNRWNYVSSTIPSAVNGSTGLAIALGFDQVDGSGLFADGTFAREWQDLISSSAEFVQIDIRDMYSFTDFFITPFPAGVIGQKSASNGLSPATAYGCKSTRVNLNVRQGTKRFVGVTEDGISSGGVLVQSRIDQVQDLCDKMGEIVVYDPTGEAVGYTPAILKRKSYTTPSGGTAYEKYPTEAEQLENSAQGISWVPYTETRTQVSRQYGRGN